MVNIAQYGLITILSIFLVFHLLVLMKIIPYGVVWGGRLKSDKEMYRFEIVSISINLFFLFVILVHSNIFTISFPKIMTTIVLWLMTALFAFNTFGNMVSKNKLEERVFTPTTFLLTIFSLILALSS